MLIAHWSAALKLASQVLTCLHIYCTLFNWTLFNSLMEAGTNSCLKQCDLHFGKQGLFPDGRVSYSRKRGCWELEIILFACFINACSYSGTVRLPNREVIPYLMILSTTAW